MISDKMVKLAQGGSAIRAMFEEGGRLAQLYGRGNVYDFSLGNPNFPPPASLKTAITDILDTEEPSAVHGYMANAGFPEVRGAVAQALNRRFGTRFGTDNIIMTVGAAGGLNVVLKTILNPGDEVLVSAPYFVEYGNYAGNFDGVLVPVMARPADFQPDIEAIRAAVGPRTKAMLVNSPNNPTGVIYTEETIRRLAAVLEDKQREYGTEIYLISDEPYRELAYDGAQVPFLTKYYDNTFICYSWSKSLSLPGERIGYLVIPDGMRDRQLVFDAACVANRILGFVNAPSLLQKAVARCIDETADLAPYDENRRLLYEGLAACGFDCVLPQGAFYLWMRTPGDEKEFAAAAKRHNILVVPGASFACPGYVRIAYCVARETIENALPAFKRLAAEYGLHA